MSQASTPTWAYDRIDAELIVPLARRLRAAHYGNKEWGGLEALHRGPWLDRAHEALAEQSRHHVHLELRLREGGRRQSVGSDLEEVLGPRDAARLRRELAMVPIPHAVEFRPADTPDATWISAWRLHRRFG